MEVEITYDYDSILVNGIKITDGMDLEQSGERGTVRRVFTEVERTQAGRRSIDIFRLITPDMILHSIKPGKAFLYSKLPELSPEEKKALSEPFMFLAADGKFKTIKEK